MIVGVFANPAYEGLGGLLEQLAAAGPRRGITFRPEPGILDAWPGDAPPLDLAADPPDMLMCLGGDGSMLRTVRAVGARELPVLGVKIGRVGFLTSVTPERLEDALEAVAGGRYTVESRRTLQAGIVGADGRTRHEAVVLNDVVVHKAGVARVVRLTVSLGDQEVGTFSSDGVIVATPTGSTAYSLSAGGPVLLPGVDALLITPICPHTLAVRPIVVPGTSRISIAVLPPRGEEEVYVSYDGQVGQTVEEGERVLVSRASYAAKLVRLGTEGFFARMRRQLKWGDLSERERS